MFEESISIIKEYIKISAIKHPCLLPQHHTKKFNYHILKMSLKHWFNMRIFVRTQDQSKEPSLIIMHESIGEGWTASNCTLCVVYDIPACKGCPIDELDTNCNDLTAVWQKFSKATTWGEWLQSSNEMIRLLWSLIKKYEEK